VRDDDAVRRIGAGENLPHPLPQSPETIRPEVTRRHPCPVLDPDRSDVAESGCHLHQPGASVSGNVSAYHGVALHRDSAAGEEKMNHW
jgi:hypothetical protein